MMRMNRLAPAGLVLALALVGSAAVNAQEDAPCPAALVCVEYADQILELDPADGPIQFLVVRLEVTTITSFAGQSTTEEVTLALFVNTGDTFEHVEDRDYARDGPLDDAEFGDSFGITELD